MMKKVFLSVLCLVGLLAINLECFADDYLVYMFRGDEVKVWITDNPPFKGDGIIIVGPFNIQVDPNINGTTITTLSEKEIPTTAGSPINPETATAYFVYGNSKGITMVEMQENSDWKGLLAHFKEKGCAQHYGIVWSTEKGKGTLNINGKQVPVKGGVLTTNKGDILIGGEPIDFE